MVDVRQLYQRLALWMIRVHYSSIPYIIQANKVRDQRKAVKGMGIGTPRTLINVSRYVDIIPQCVTYKIK